jgi:hypothetical protein
MSGDEMPLIGVFIDDVQQEFMPRPAGARDWNDFYWDDQWTSDWRQDGNSPWHKEWNQDHGSNKSNPVRNITSLGSLIMREEPFGGLAYDPVLRTVFALNKFGYAIMTSIQKRTREDWDDVPSVRSAVIKMVTFLASYGVAPTESEIEFMGGI